MTPYQLAKHFFYRPPIRRLWHAWIAYRNRPRSIHRRSAKFLNAFIVSPDLETIRVMDIGARDGVEAHWMIFNNKLEVFGFEPDPAACKAANEGSGPNETYYPVALDKVTGERKLNLSADGYASSFLTFNQAVMSRFPHGDRCRVVGSEILNVVRLDELTQRENIPPIDFMKVDTEGSELDILAGAPGVITSLLGISIEAFFQEVHLGRPLFADVDACLRSQGFTLFVLQNDLWRRKAAVTEDLATWHGQGQIMFAQAIYLRDVSIDIQSNPSRWTSERVLKACAIAAVFKLEDVAHEWLHDAHTAGIVPSDKAQRYLAFLMGDIENTHNK